MRSDVRAALVHAAADAAEAELEQIDAELGADDFDEGRLDELRVKAENLANGLSPVAEALVEAERVEEAEVLLTPLLRHLHSGPTEQIEEALGRFGKGTTRSFNAALATWLSHRPTETFVRLGRRLNPEALGDAAAPQLGELLARLWREVSEEESEEASDALLSVGDLHRGGATIELGRLQEEIAEGFSTGIQAQQGINRMRGRIALLEKARKLDLVASEAAAEIVLGFAQRTLGKGPAEGHAAALAAFVRECFVEYADDAPESLLASCRETLSVAASWIASHSPDIEIIRLRLAGASAAKGESKSPYTPEEIGALVAEYGSVFVPGVVAWLERFSPTPGQAAKALRPLLRVPLDSRFARALSAFSERQTPTGRYRLVRPLIQWPARGSPPPRLLLALGIRGADPDRVTAAILERYERSSNNREREAALGIWRTFEPDEAKHRRILIRQVFMPLCEHGVGGYELCRRYLDLCEEPPRGTKTKLLELLSKTAPNPELACKMERRRRALGLA